ncbi:hypothetical protein DACRYDRAFT_24025 [Dacryopinax primogenitus]|uniref:Uncharacterized protein n=1 Tax=Dacryopinax primogenitus (strain DJM 731) TaxID=1858805 RepID=M5FQ11_DACPD|nr:uncharacterized protein DACRYDRAFT_24025 [Dacryopinax primogenitus]EJT98905.1 hypothetical protein DACRYDRAFT_24025 [Dacryopinax primogenitus]
MVPTNQTLSIISETRGPIDALQEDEGMSRDMQSGADWAQETLSGKPPKSRRPLKIHGSGNTCRLSRYWRMRTKTTHIAASKTPLENMVADFKERSFIQNREKLKREVEVADEKFDEPDIKFQAFRAEAAELPMELEEAQKEYGDFLEEY